MPFTVELFFSGIGLAILRTSEDRSRKPNRVDLLLLRTDAHPNMHHRPRLSFELRDVVAPVVDIADVRPTPFGMMMVDKPIEGQSLALEATGGKAEFDVEWAQNRAATEPAHDARADAFDWLPSFDHSGLPTLVLPEDDRDGEIYSASLSLPPGQIRSRRILFGKYADGPRQARWTLPTGVERVMADQMVWTRSGLESLSIAIRDPDDAVRTYTIDGEMRRLEGEVTDSGEPVVPLAFTNFPEYGKSGRFAPPRHFHMYGALAGPDQEIADVALASAAGPVTGQGACPPMYYQIVE